MAGDTTGAGAHLEHEEYGWSIHVGDHPRRADSPEYVAARKAMHARVDTVAEFFYGEEPFQDHHGGGLWLKDADGWFMVRNLAGIEWSAQFCADPAKVDVLRTNARRVYAAFPDAVVELGIRELLDTPITDADGVARWTDSICNASVPLPQLLHTGVLPKGGGIHHYPTPVVEIGLFKRDDFDLWVKDDQGNDVAVTPVARRGDKDGRVFVAYAPPGSALAAHVEDAAQRHRALFLTDKHPIAQRAFAEQYRKLDAGEIGVDDPLALTR